LRTPRCPNRSSGCCRTCLPASWPPARWAGTRPGPPAGGRSDRTPYRLRAAHSTVQQSPLV